MLFVVWLVVMVSLNSAILLLMLVFSIVTILLQLAVDEGNYNVICCLVIGDGVLELCHTIVLVVFFLCYNVTTVGC